jgi:putative tryptophan/tyrosine transport system substrate-binding protein
MRTLRFVLLALGTALLALPWIAGAQGPTKVFRLGALWTGSASSMNVSAFKQALREHGYIEGQNIVIEERLAKGDIGKFPELAAELVRLNLDVLVTTSVLAAQTVAKLTRTLPIVVTGGGDLVATGLAASLARPGGNITGLTALSPELSAKRLELLKEVAPAIKRVAVLWNPAGPSPKLAFKESQSAARRLGLQIQSLEVRTSADLERVMKSLGTERADGLLVIQDPIVAGNAGRIVAMVAERRVPAIYPSKQFVDAGGLISYGPNYVEMYRRAAYYADRIFKGAKASDLPIEQPTRFELTINVKTARTLGLSVPRGVLSRADAVIE